MIDLFGRKRLAFAEQQKRELQAELDRAIDDLAVTKGRLFSLLDTVRQMDQTIHNMSQQTSWEGMCPYFQALLNQTRMRMTQESTRIGEVIRRELAQQDANVQQEKRMRGL